MRISVFSTGRVRQKRGDRGVRRYLANDWRDEALPVNVFLIEHPEGLCLVDAGQTATAAMPDYFPSWYPFFRLARFELEAADEAAAQLATAGFDIARVRWVVLTHLHTDHVGGLGAFRGAQVLVTRREWELAEGIGGRIRGYLPQRWPTGVAPHIVDFHGPPLGPFQSSFDVSADGRLVLLPLPGHTAGHAALLVRDTPNMFLCAGDAAPCAEDFYRSGGDVAAWCRRENVVVLTTHDDDAGQLLNLKGVKDPTPPLG